MSLCPTLGLRNVCGRHLPKQKHPNQYHHSEYFTFKGINKKVFSLITQTVRAFTVCVKN